MVICLPLPLKLQLIQLCLVLLLIPLLYSKRSKNLTQDQQVVLITCFLFSCILTIPFYATFGVKHILLQCLINVTSLRWAIIDQYLLHAHCKLIECIIKYQLLSLLLPKGFVNKQQHDFISTRDWSLSLHGKQLVDDYGLQPGIRQCGSQHSKLIHKLSCFGINGLNLLKWIEAFLYCRSQCVIVENHYSS